MMSMWWVIGLIGFGAFLVIASMIVCAAIIYKYVHAMPGERFLGGAPKGQVFTIPEADAVADFPDAESTVLAKSEKFLQSLIGGKT